MSAYRQDIQRSLTRDPPVLTLDVADPNARAAQTLALRDPRFLEGSRDVVSQRPLRNEIAGIYPLRDSDLVLAELQTCKASRVCYRVEMYSFAHNETRVAFVDATQGRVLTVNRLVATQPEISARHLDLALDLASTSEVVRTQLGRTPRREEFLMGTTKTSLARTSCERTLHLCVAPTIVEGNSALFVVVDLTALRVVGTRWNKVGRVVAPTERRVQNEAIARLYCDRATKVERNGWSFNYQITSSDGVRVADVVYRGESLLRSVKTVDWHVAYSWKDKLGYSDAVGCPVFSQAAVVAIDPPTLEPIRENGAEIGFALTQDFRSDQWPRPCNYFYRQRFEFFDDGRFRPWAASYGRGCGEGGNYRPVTRIEFAEMTQVEASTREGWVRWGTERWARSRDLVVSVDRSKLRFTSQTGVAIDVRPNDAVAGEHGSRPCQSCHDSALAARPEASDSLGLPQTRGDDAYVYVTLHPPGRDEGASDLPPIGTCCNDDHRQGPEKFMTPPEAIPSDNRTPLVLWYVAQMQNDNRSGKEYCWADTVLRDGLYVPKAYPCYSGPMLIARRQFVPKP
ncbi:MAG: hypothetical protein JNL19_10355 [Burkholderiales bacterium]|nr:hypothetical protein [Burkholderiales bacterium]